MLPTPPAHPPPTGMNVRQKERVLLGLDEAFGVGRRRFDGGAPGSGSGSNLDAVLYQKLPCEVLLQEVSICPTIPPLQMRSINMDRIPYPTAAAS